MISRSAMEKSKKLQLHRFIYWIIIVAFIAIITTFFYINIEKFDNQEFSFSTISGKKISQTLVGSDCYQVSEVVKNEISNMEKKLSHNFCDSDIDRLNNSNGNWVSLDDDTIEILDKIIRISRKTHGFYDPTHLVLINFYDQNSSEKMDDKILSEKLKKVNFNFIEIDKANHRARINENGTVITLDDIIDGLACNFAIDFYKKSKINKAIIQVGTCTGYLNSDDNPNNIKDGFICNLSESERIINPNSGRVITRYLPKSFYHPSDCVIACIMARICASNDDDKSSKIIKTIDQVT